MKFLLLFNLLIGGVYAQEASSPDKNSSPKLELISSDRFILKIVDKAVTKQDILYQARNITALNCVYEDSLVVNYFGAKSARELQSFAQKIPSQNDQVAAYLNKNGPMLEKTRLLFKMLRYAQDQNKTIPTEVSKIIRELAKVNKCDENVLFKDRLKTNFETLLQLEIYLKSRYEGQLRGGRLKFESVKSSIDLFVETLDKQFAHEYYR